MINSTITRIFMINRTMDHTNTDDLRGLRYLVGMIRGSVAVSNTDDCVYYHTKGVHHLIVPSEMIACSMTRMRSIYLSYCCRWLRVLSPWHECSAHVGGSTADIHDTHRVAAHLIYMIHIGWQHIWYTSYTLVAVQVWYIITKGGSTADIHDTHRCQHNNDISYEIGGSTTDIHETQQVAAQ